MHDAADAQQATRATARGKRTRLSRAARQEQVLDIAEELFTTRGYDATSIEDIARAAGVTRPIIYDHYGSKEGVLIACVRRARAQFEQAFTEAVVGHETSDLPELVERGGAAFFTMLERDPRRWALLFSNTTALAGDFSEQLTDLRFGTVERIVVVVRIYLPEADEEHVRAFAHAISGVGEQLGRWWLRSPDIPRERIIAYYRDFIVSGMSGLLADTRRVR